MVTGNITHFKASSDGEILVRVNELYNTKTWELKYRVEYRIGNQQVKRTSQSFTWENDAIRAMNNIFNNLMEVK